MWIALLLTAWLSPVANAAPDKIPAKVQSSLDAAEVAWKANDLEKAEDLLTEATTAMPTLDKAWRRKCGVVLSTGRTMDAIELCRTAVQIDANAENKTALALALVRDAADVDPATAPGMEEARKLLDSVTAVSPDYVQTWAALCEWARLTDDLATAERCVGALERLEPEKAGTLYFRALLDAAKSEWPHARTSLIAARNVGLQDDLYQPLAARITAATADRAAPTAPDGPEEKPGAKSETDLSHLLPLFFAGGLLLMVAAIALRNPPEGADDVQSPFPTAPNGPNATSSAAAPPSSETAAPSSEAATPADSHAGPRPSSPPEG